MGRKRTRVNKIRDIIRYQQTTTLSERQIARALAVSRTVVARTLQAFRESGLSWAEVPSMADSALQQRLMTTSTPPRRRSATRSWPLDSPRWSRS